MGLRKTTKSYSFKQVSINMENENNNKSDIIVKLKNVKKTYKVGKYPVHALKNVTVNFKRGFTVIYGPSASGKTTLLNLIGCIDKVDEGQILFGGIDITKVSPRELTKLRRSSLGFVFQTFGLIPVLTVYENIEYPILKYRMTRKERKKAILFMLEEVGLGGHHKRKPSELSGGQQQRVSVARALISKPKLVIADEPTANLDSKTSDAIINLMWKMHEEHDTNFIISSHSAELIEHFENKIEIKDGTITKND